MTGKNQTIRAIGEQPTQESEADEAEIVDADQSANADEPVLDLTDSFTDYEEPGAPRFGWIAPSLALIAVVAWTGLYVWALRSELTLAASAAPTQWVRWIIDWSVPVLLIGVVWLVAMRNSSREANRFAATAAMLSHESAELERRLTVVNRELSLAREFLASQSRELDSLGRIAADRISTHADTLQGLIKSNGAQVEAIGSASETALANMTSLRDDLPVIANSARDVNNQVGNTGRTANDQLDKLVAGFERLNTFGSASENQVKAIEARIGETISGFEAQLQRIEQSLIQRFEALQNQTETYRSDITEAETQALSGMNDRISLLQSETRAVGMKLREAGEEAMTDLRNAKENWENEVAEMIGKLEGLDQQATAASQLRIKELRDEAARFDDRLQERDLRFFEEMTRRQAEFETRETQASEVLAQRLSELDDVMQERREAQIAETEKLVAKSSELTSQLDQLRGLIAEIEQHGDKARTSLGSGMSELSQTLEAKREELAQTEASLGTLTESGIRLLEIIQSGARHSREDLPAAIDEAAERLSGVEQKAAVLSGAMFAMGQKGEDLSNYLIQTNEGIAQADTSLEKLQSQLSQQSEDALSKLNGLRSGLSDLTDQSARFGNETQETLKASIAELEQATQRALISLDQGARDKVSTLAENLSGEAIAALERALRNNSAETIGQLEQAAAHASGVGREATLQLRDQLARVNELTGNLEQRVARARELAEEQVDNDFARRMALITDSLNSAAIDISGAISEEVTDTAWDAYLKGDRGIFTRRAVRLLENGQSREIAELYQNDETFHANVSRYIHDFEAMLRAMLSTRDGKALSVTVLGSDMGKLYVALAQSIERLRN